jgi:hypothetical protein
MAMNVRAEMAHNKVVGLDRREQCADAASDRSNVDPEQAQFICREIVQFDGVALQEQDGVTA